MDGVGLIENKWYSLTEKEIFTKLDSNLEGLKSSDAKERLLRYGKNVLPKKQSDGPLKIFFMQFLSPIIFVMVLAGILSLAAGEYLDFLQLYLLF